MLLEVVAVLRVLVVLREVVEVLREVVEEVADTHLRPSSAQGFCKASDVARAPTLLTLLIISTRIYISSFTSDNLDISA